MIRQSQENIRHQAGDNLIVLGDEGQGIALIKEKGLLDLLKAARKNIKKLPTYRRKTGYVGFLMCFAVDIIGLIFGVNNFLAAV